MNPLKTIGALLLAGVAVAASAQQINVATGGKSGSYSRMLTQMAGTCKGAALVEVNTSGSMDALEKLMGNQVNAAFVQTDVLHLRAKTEDLGAIKTLLALHPESVHIVARTDLPINTGGVMGVGGTSRPVKELTDLAGQKVAAAGGSVITAQVMRLQSEVPFSVVPVDSNEIALKALADGKVHAVVMVGGAPFPLVAGLTKPFTLVAIAPATMEKLKNVYRPTRLSYSKMGASGVPTVSTDALLVTRSYKTARMLAPLRYLRACALEHLDEIKETTGTHPAWQAVDAANKGKWAWLE